MKTEDNIQDNNSDWQPLVLMIIIQ